MKLNLILLFLLLLVAAGNSVWSEELSFYLVPSEDELLKLLVTGEINYEQYQNSLEILNLSGFDNSLSYYEFFNLSRFDYQRDDIFSGTENEQVEIFKEQDKYLLKGSLSHNYATEIKDNSRSRYRSSLKLDLSQKYRFNLKVQKEYSGRERIVYRNFTYVPDSDNVRQIVIGNYSHKIGLGGVYGYRGKMFDYSNKIDDESLLYPDYGGSNGILAQFVFDKWQLDQLLSVNRDSDNSLFTFGANLKLNRSSLAPYLSLGITKFKNRRSGYSINDLKLAFGFKADYQKSYFALEAVSQTAYQSGLAALLGEGVHRFESGNIKYSFWYYSDDYLDFTGGGKAVYLTSHIDIDTLDYTYSDRRVGQKGGSIRATVLFMPQMKWSNALLYGAKNSDSLNLEFQSELDYRLNSNYSLGLKHLRRYRKRIDDNPDDNRRSDTRVELSYNKKNIAWRTYWGYRTDDKQNDYLSYFATLRFQTERLGIIRLWVNLYRIQTDLKMVDYGYLFAENKIKWYENWYSTVKLSYTYNRRSSVKDLTVLSMEIIRTL